MTISCCDACGRTTEDEMSAQRDTWAYLFITKRYRCPACHAALRAAAGITGTAVDKGDALPPDSRGALPKETASTILLPSVKG